MNAKFIALGAVVVLSLAAAGTIVFKIKGVVDDNKEKQRQEALLVEQEKAGKGVVVIYATDLIEKDEIIPTDKLVARLVKKAEAPKNRCHRTDPIVGRFATREIKTGTIITTDAITETKPL